MKVYRASTKPSELFDPLDSSGSIRGPKGWRFNDTETEILYVAEVEALAILEVTVRPGWQNVEQILIATIELPDDSIVTPPELNIVLPSNWNARPAQQDSRCIAREFLNAIARLGREVARPIGLRVPSVLSGSDHNILIDPSRRSELKSTLSNRVPFKTLAATST